MRGIGGVIKEVAQACVEEDAGLIGIILRLRSTIDIRDEGLPLAV